MKIVSLLKGMRHEFTIGDVGDVTAAAVDLDVNLVLQLAEV